MLIFYGYVLLVISGIACLRISSKNPSKEKHAALFWSFVIFIINLAGIVYYTYSDKEVIYKKDVNVITKDDFQYADINNDGRLVRIMPSGIFPIFYDKKVTLQSYKFQRYGIFYPMPNWWH